MCFVLLMYYYKDKIYLIVFTIFFSITDYFFLKNALKINKNKLLPLIVITITD